MNRKSDLPLINQASMSLRIWDSLKCIEAEIQSLTFGEILKIVTTSEATW